MMLTRCPSCGTTFRVTPDQLKVRQGQVRCGKCRQVFDALGALAEDAATMPAPSPAEKDSAWVVVEAARPDDDTRLEPGLEPAFVPVEDPVLEPHFESIPESPTGFQPLSEPTANGVPGPEPAPEAEPVAEVIFEPLAEPVVEPVAAELPHEPEVRESSGPTGEVNAEPLPIPERRSKPRFAPEFVTDFEPDFEPEPEPVLELHEDVEPRPRRWPWVVGAVLALLILAGQVLLHFRTELVTLAPDARPILGAACKVLGCTLALPHKIDLIGIESSDMAPDDAQQPGTLHLTASLRNRASFAQAWPHLELTLTDAQERPLLRRALAPTDYLAATAAITAGFPRRSEQPVQLTLKIADVPAVGYRLYVFYP